VSGEVKSAIDQRLLILVAWVWVAVPFGYGIYQLMHKIKDLFQT